ncbi:MAG: carboxypeptidase-like regulatory domain-containing protein [Armatimonadota bacterium]|jgi:hypothetical protein
MHRRAKLGWLTGLIIAVALIAAGCGGGNGQDGGPAPTTGTATLNGQVVSASSTGTLIANAVVTVEGTGRSAMTGADGGFVITNLPAGERVVSVTTPQSAEYGTASARVALVSNQTKTVSFAVLPLGLQAPERILVDPGAATVDMHGRIAYRAQVIGPNNQVLEGIEPTWVVDGGIGQITPEGVFTAHTVGSGNVKAYSGNAQRSASVTVVGPRPPQVSSFRVNPQSLPATGGEVFISAAIKDGDGVRPDDVKVRILRAGEQPIELAMQVMNPGSAIRCPDVPDCYVEASFGVTHQVPANSNTPTADGTQAPQSYSASVRVRDRSGMTTDSEFVEFVVQGIDAPPVRPGI